MKKLLLLFIISTVAVSSIYANKFNFNKDERWKVIEQNISLKGSPKTLKSEEFDVEVNLGKINKGRRLTSRSYSFNSSGYVIKQNKSYDESSIEVLEYNKDGSLSERCSYDKQGVLSTKTIYKYNEFGWMTEMFSYDNKGTLTGKCTQSYENQGDKSTGLIYIKNNLYNKVIIEYKGNTRTRQSLRDGLLQSKEVCTLDNAMITENIYRYNNGNVESVYTINRYDCDNNLIEKTTFNSDTNSVLQKQIYRYDKYGNIIEERDMNDNLVYLYEYKIDSSGNYTQKITYKSNAKIAIKIEIRTISYY